MSTTIDRPVPALPGEMPKPRTRSVPAQILRVLASLQLTVYLFALSILLVFFGTLAQRDSGIWTVVEKYFWSWYVWVPFDLIHQFGTVFFGWSKDVHWDSSFPLPAGKLLGGLMLVNLLAAHALRFRFTLKRSGIILIHSGLILLFVGEFITREFAIEQRMTIDEGATVNFAEDTRNYELAFVDKSDSRTDKVTVIPASRLQHAEGRISHPDLPVDVAVVQYMVNSKMRDPEPGLKNPATAGLAVQPKTTLIAVNAPEVSGVDPNQNVDIPSAYVTLYRKGTDQALGTYLVTVFYSFLPAKPVDKLQLDGKTFDLSLRFKRYYKNFGVELVKFRFDRYPGTQKAKNFSSDVIVYQNGEKVREQTIRMNEPMRFEGETFYQQSFERSERTTILQVVDNPGWLLPYVSCTMVGLGLVLHFSLMLLSFLRKPRAAAPSTAAVSPEPVALPAAESFGEPGPAPPGWLARNWDWLIPVGVGAILGIYLLSVYGRMKPKDAFDLDTLARLPVLEGGRVKPLDTVARVYLRKISHQSDFKDANGDTQPAIRWYLDTLGADAADKNEPAWNYKVVRIESDQVLHELKLDLREGLRYSVNELREHFGKIEESSRQARIKRDAKKSLEPAEIKMIDLNEKLALLIHVAQGKGHDTPENRFHLIAPQSEDGQWVSYGEFKETAEFSAFAQSLANARARVRAQPGGLDEVAKEVLWKRFLGPNWQQRPAQQRERLVDIIMSASPAEIPPDARTEIYDGNLALLPPGEQAEQRANYEAENTKNIAANPAAALWSRMIDARKAKKYEEFNTLVKEYRDKYLGHVPATDLSKDNLEISYNRFAPFLRCIAFYAIAIVLSSLAFAFRAAEWPRLSESFRISAVAVLGLALVIHTVGLVVRMDLSGRWFVFVTNLYSSAIFIGCGCVALGLILERVFPMGIGAIVAAVLGFATTLVAHNLATEDTLEMMQAVLDTNFWLATHVTTVTLGYTATYVAGFLGVMFVFLMFCAVIRDSFATPGAPTGDRLLAYGAASAGVVFIPLSIGWVLFDSLAKFEVINSVLGELLRYGMLAAGALYFIALLLNRATTDGVDAHGKPVAAATPRLAKPLAGMALSPHVSKTLAQMIYGVLCFATMLSFIGTVLGGIWADQSWGRFWGWDPKENGAVLIVLWNALILHARWCGLVKGRGMAVLGIFGNMVTAWSWFGTNQLGIGLHAYGFDTRLADGCFNFWLSMLMIAALGLIPSQHWSGTTPVAALAPAPKAKPARRK
jgi:ABC-type transport system involved in cytochrome c biogenesis permease subunit